MKYAIISSGIVGIALARLGAFANQVVVSKGGLRMFTRSLAVELGEIGITINNVAPGAIETPINRVLMEDQEKLRPLLRQIPLGRMGQPNDVAAAVAFLASPDADYVTGETLVVDGGLIRNYRE